MSVQEIDTELWRRLVINAWWLFKSKGSRKVIEFLIKLFGLTDCLIDFDEAVYVADNKLDVEKTFYTIERFTSGNTIENGIPTIAQVNGTAPRVDRSLYPMDEQGFPKTLPETQEYYFQMDGFWYNGGTQRTTGNNPHYGPYDYGSKYFEKFTCFIDDFSGRTDVTLLDYTENVNLFPDYNNGDLEITFEDGKPLMDYSKVYAQTMIDNDRVSNLTELVSAGFSTEKSRTGLGSLKLTFNQVDTGEIIRPRFYLDLETGLALIQPIGDEQDDTTPTTSLNQSDCLYYGFDYEPSRFSELYKSTLDEEALTLYTTYEQLLDEKYYQSVGTTACFWCLPAIPVCDFTSYFQILIQLEGLQGLIEVLINEGILSPNDVELFQYEYNQDPSGTLINVITWYDTRYSGYCLIVHDNFKEVTEQCCGIRGGEWVDIDGNNTFKCVTTKEIIIPPSCDGFEPSRNLPDGTVSWLDTVNQVEKTIVSEECCINNGFTASVSGDGFKCYGTVRTTPFTVCPDDVVVIKRGRLVYSSTSGQVITEQCCGRLGGSYESDGVCYTVAGVGSNGPSSGPIKF
jgi:hypothetical protein